MVKKGSRHIHEEKHAYTSVYVDLHVEIYWILGVV